ncbi:MAG: YmdB family metallophosphoesterase, partial [Clostridia bacterium]|nr:YmdB family metallophosphoesterase [Clostridia bacterium]
MKILAIGDVVGKVGVEFLKSKLSSLKKEYEVDFVIANGEN